MMSPLFLIFATCAVAIPQYDGPFLCAADSDCVDERICVDGVIDAYAGIDPRNKLCRSPNVCCKIPGRDSGGQTGPDPTYKPCSSPTQACVQKDLCLNGKINTAGVGLIDLRFKGTDTITYQTCFDESANAPGVCCEEPATTPTFVKECPHGHECTAHSACTNYDEVQQQQQADVGRLDYEAPSVSLNCKLNDDPYVHDIGVCCKSAVVYELCSVDETCVYEENCGFDSYNPTAPNKCLVPGTTAAGVCCKAQRPPCEEGTYCTPLNYCSAKGFLVDAPHTQDFYSTGSKCHLNTGETGVCCNPKPLGCDSGEFCSSPNDCPHLDLVAYASAGKTCSFTTSYGAAEPGVCCPPPPKIDCGGDHICAPREYCNSEGIIANDIVPVPYSLGNECSLPGSNSAVCCKIYVPRETIECPLNTICMHNANTCPTAVLEQGGTDIYSKYSSNKTYQTCSSHNIGGGHCCNAELHCGQNPLAKPTITQQFYTDEVTAEQGLFGEMPWQGIVFNKANTYKCGATLVGDRYLLTVAHCVHKETADNLRVRLGEWQINGFDEILSYEDISVAEVIVHPKFNERKVWNNMAILVLSHPVKFSFHINRICLPNSPFQFPAGKRCVISGWGKDTFSGSFRQIIKKVDVPLVEFNKCEEQLQKTRLSSYFQLHESYICAGGEPGKDACTGDGGGPLFCYDDVLQRHVLVGLTAWGIGCGEPGVPAVYSGIEQNRDFISQHIPNWDTGSDGIVPTPY